MGASLAATVALVVLPGLTVAAFLRLTGAVLPPALGWLVTAAVSFAYMFTGSKLWARHPRSANLGFGELVLWTWARRRRAEGTLRRGEDLLDVEIGELLNPQGRREQVKVLRELNAALEVRDPYTRGHARRVERHAHRIALALRCSDDDIFDIRLAANLHDVGKIKVPDSILRKDGPLDGQEWAVMKQHSEVGADLLARLGNQAVVDSVRWHHERWDGAGYPDGIYGTRIPLGARIIAVADTFDAITSCRPYRNRSDRAHAISVLKAEAGSQFDPAVVSAFLATTPHHAVAFAGIAALIAPMGRKLASQWGVVFNKAGAVTLAGTMTASAFTGAAAVDRVAKPKREREAKVRAAEPAAAKSQASGAVDRPAGAPDSRGKALGHDKKAHEGGNGKSRAGGAGPALGHDRHDKEKDPQGKALGHGDKAAPGERGKALGHDKKANAGGKGKAPFKEPKGETAAKAKPSKPDDAGSGAPQDESPAAAPAPDPAPSKPAKVPKPPKAEEPAPAPETPAEAPVVEAPAPAPEPPSPGNGKGNGKKASDGGRGF